MGAKAVKGACPKCGGHAEFDESLVGVPLTCPHCSQQTVFDPVVRTAERPNNNQGEAIPPVQAERRRFRLGIEVGVVLGVMVVAALAAGMLWPATRPASQANGRPATRSSMGMWTPVTATERAEAVGLITRLPGSFDRFTKTTYLQFNNTRFSQTIILTIALSADNRVSLLARVQQFQFEATHPTKLLFESRGVVRSALVTSTDTYYDFAQARYEMALCDAHGLAEVLEAASTADSVRARMQGMRLADVELVRGSALTDLKAMVLIYRAALENPALLSEAARRAGRGAE